MNTGSPPTAPNARTGEFTPPGITARARRNSVAESGALVCGSRESTAWIIAGPLSEDLFAGVGQELKQPQSVRQRMLPRIPYPLRGAATATASRGDDVAVSAVPAQPGHRSEAVGLAVQVARPPFVLVSRRATSGDKEK